MRKINLSENSSLPTQTSVDSPKAVDNNKNLKVTPANSMGLPDQEIEMKKNQKKFLTFAFVAIVLGVVTGFSGYKLYAKSGGGLASESLPAVAEGSVKAGDIFGSNDDSFKDTAKGYLEAGGFDDEGSHKLLRPGGASQTVYLTSSVTDLSKLEGMEVEVWGETFKGQKVGWLMDVGKIKVVDPNGTPPTE
jgi:hypothetical protein